MIKAYIFDLDGTLMDSMGYFADGMIKILKEDSVPYPDDIMNIITPMGTIKAANYFKRLGVKGSTEEILGRMGENMLHLYTSLVKTKPFVREYLEKLKNSGKKLYVLTASPHLTVDPCLKSNGIYELFSTVWSTDDFGTLTKSEGTALFEAVTEKIGCKPYETAYFDDNIIALENAGAAGFYTVGVFDEHYEIPSDRVRAASHKYIMSFEEMLKEP